MVKAEQKRKKPKIEYHKKITSKPFQNLPKYVKQHIPSAAELYEKTYLGFKTFKYKGGTICVRHDVLIQHIIWMLNYYKVYERILIRNKLNEGKHCVFIFEIEQHAQDKVELTHKYLMYKTLDTSFTITPNFDMDEMTEFVHDIKSHYNLISCRFSYVHGQISFADGDAHANGFFYDKKTETLYHYEPHGSSFPEYQYVVNILEKLFSVKDKNGKKIINYVSMNDKCPIGLQEFVVDDIGLCTSFVMYWIDTVTKNLNKNDDVLSYDELLIEYSKKGERRYEILLNVLDLMRRIIDEIYAESKQDKTYENHIEELKEFLIKSLREDPEEFEDTIFYLHKKNCKTCGKCIKTKK